MGVRDGIRALGPLVIAVLACGVLLVPGSAVAATVVNGNFESGNLNGWHVHRALEAGNWFAYEGSAEPLSEKRGDGRIQPPPEGNFAAIADEIDPDTLVLSQEIALEPGLEHHLSLLAYYDSYVPIAVPTPDTLSAESGQLEGQANQQFRIDVMKPGTPIESLDPADILMTVFQTNPGDPQRLPPTKLTANLSPFAGQTVRLRIAVAAHEEVLAAGVDAVSITSNLPGQPPGGSKNQGSKSPGSTLLRFGKAKLNPGNGTATLPVKVPGPGMLKAQDGSAAGSGSKAIASAASKSKALIKPVTARAKAAGTVTIHLQPTGAAHAILSHKHKLRVKVEVTYTPTGGSAHTATVPVTLKLNRGPRQPR
jgi:hypothetical protein